MTYRRGVLLLLLTVLLTAATGTAAAQEDVTVFPVVDDDGEGQGTVNRYQGVAGHPERAVALVPASGQLDALRYRGRTFQSYGFGTQNLYLDAAPRGEGGWWLVGLSQEEGGTLWSFDGSGVRPALSANVTLRAVAASSDGDAVVAGGLAAPARSALVAIPAGGEPRSVPLPDPAPLRAAAYHPGGDGAVVAGIDGALYRYRNGSVASIPGAGDAFLDGVAWRPDGDAFVAVGAASTNGTAPAGGGAVYAGNASGVRRVATLEHVLRDVDWRPGGGTALAVGGGNGSATLYELDDAGVDDRRRFGAEAPVAVAWYDGENALVAGGRELWRYALDADPAEMPATASLTVVPPRPDPDERFQLSGYGSTNRGSTARIEGWQFAVGGSLTEWQPSPFTPGEIRRAGEYTVGVRVRTADGTVSPWRNASLTVGDPRPERDSPRGDAPIWLLMGLTGVVIAALLVVSTLRRRRA